MRVSTKTRPTSSIVNAYEYKKGRDFEFRKKVDSFFVDNGLLIFGSTTGREIEVVPTEIEISWSQRNKALRMKYMLQNSARGVLLSEIDKVILPEKTFMADKPLGGFEFIADNEGSSFLFGQFIDAETSPEIFVETGVNNIQTKDVTRMVNFNIDRLMSGLLGQKPVES